MTIELIWASNLSEKPPLAHQTIQQRFSQSFRSILSKKNVWTFGKLLSFLFYQRWRPLCRIDFNPVEKLFLYDSYGIVDYDFPSFSILFDVEISKVIYLLGIVFFKKSKFNSRLSSWNYFASDNLFQREIMNK